MIHLYCGDGKGKTTCACGLAVRFAGSGGRVLFCQFLKDGTSSELKILRSLPSVCVLKTNFPPKFTYQMNEEEKRTASEMCTELLEKAAALMIKESYGMLVLDEAVYAVSLGFLSEEKLIDIVEDAGRQAEIVITGGNPGKALIDSAAYGTEMKKIKHPFDTGAGAREGIEY